MKLKISKSLWEKIGVKKGWTISKVRDLSTVKGKIQPAICVVCGKWAVDTGWKHYYQMSKEEMTEVDDIKKKFESGLVTFVSALCENCQESGARR